MSYVLLFPKIIAILAGLLSILCITVSFYRVYKNLDSPEDRLIKVGIISTEIVFMLYAVYCCIQIFVI